MGRDPVISFHRSSQSLGGMFSFQILGACMPVSRCCAVMPSRWLGQEQRKREHLPPERGGWVLSQTTHLVMEARGLPPRLGGLGRWICRQSLHFLVLLSWPYWRSHSVGYCHGLSPRRRSGSLGGS